MSGDRRALPPAVTQIALLALTNVFVGGMVGLERTVLPLIAEEDFGIASTTAALAFIATFGATKAAGNLVAGSLSDRWGRRRILLAGWVIGLPVPILLMETPSWSWILLANVLLGVNQALTWSMTLVMKVDLAGPRRRGLVIGLNEFAGYAGLAAAAFLTAIVASRYGLRPEPFYLGLGLALAGLVLSALARETHAVSGMGAKEGVSLRHAEERLGLLEAFRRATWADRGLAPASLAGLLTNFKDGMLWGLLPLFLTAKGLPIARVGVVVALYPATWAVMQLLFGPLSDQVGRKALIVAGMVLQAIGVWLFVLVDSFAGYLSAAALAGLGTAMTYPTLLAQVSDVARAGWRASAQGVFRFWRDFGYVAGALGTGFIADRLGFSIAMLITAALILVAARVVATGLRATPPERPTRDRIHRFTIPTPRS